MNIKVPAQIRPFHQTWLAGLLAGLIFCLIATAASAQKGSTPALAEKDLVTLHNGNQLLGYIIEQRPGESISVYRPELKDTVKVSLDDVYKITRINILILPVVNGSGKVDSSLIGKRYNCKRNTVNFGYQQIQSKELRAISLHGINLGYSRNIRNRFSIGLQSSYLFMDFFPENRRLDVYYNVNFHRIQLLAEGKVRLFGKKTQRSLLSLLGVVNAGITVDLSTYEITQNPAEPQAPRFEYENGFTAQTLVSIRINSDKNSGFMLEPGLTWYQSRVSSYNGNGLFVQTTGRLVYQPTVRFQYFF